MGKKDSTDKNQKGVNRAKAPKQSVQSDFNHQLAQNDTARLLSNKPTIQLQRNSTNEETSLDLQEQPTSTTPIKQSKHGTVSGQKRLQPKLMVGPANDQYEQEADRIAKEVTQPLPPISGIHNKSNLPTQRKEDNQFAQMKSNLISNTQNDGFTVDKNFETTLSQQRGGGHPLPAALRADFEPKFGADFGGVRVHNNAAANDLNESIQAKAFTTGKDLFFRQGAYNPASSQGQELLAHELTHVVQQSGPAIQRTKDDDKPEMLDNFLDRETFIKHTKVWHAKRGESLSTIDKWLKAAKKAESWRDQHFALTQVLDAAAHWLEKHGGSKQKKERSSVTSRRPIIKALLREAHAQIGGSGGGTGAVQNGAAVATGMPTIPGAPSAANGKSDADTGDSFGQEMVESSFSAIADGAGITGAFGDRNVAIAPENYSGDFMDDKGSAKLNQPAFDVLEGANMFTGGLAIKNALSDYEDSDKGKLDKAEAVGNVGAGAGQIVHGGYKAAKGIALLSDADANATKWTQVGDIGAAYADGTATIAGMITSIKGAYDMRSKSKEMGGLTRYEKAEEGLEVAGNVVNTAQSGLNTGLDIYKTATGVGSFGSEAAQAAAKGTISQLAVASGVLSIVSGSIEMIHGGVKIYRGYAAKNKIKDAETEERKLLTSVQQKISSANDKIRVNLYQFTNKELLDIINLLHQLKATFSQMQAAHIEFSPSFTAIKKLENRRMEDGAFKMAKGATAVVSGALVVSGVGAPIAVGIAALGGIIALGHAGVKLKRNSAANRLTQTARRLSDDGKPRAKPDPSPSYRQMESRVYKAYYNHLPNVIEKKTPAGLSSGEFSDIKNFAWSDKKNRIKSQDKEPIKAVSEVAGLPESTRRDKWVEVRDEQGNATDKEKPKSISKVNLLISASAHKSSQAQNASREEIVQALYKLGTQSFDPTTGTFHNSPIVPVGNASPETMKEYGDITLQALLGAADITESRWAAWVKKSNQDEAKMRKYILSHIS